MLPPFLVSSSFVFDTVALAALGASRTSLIRSDRTGTPQIRLDDLIASDLPDHLPLRLIKVSTTCNAMQQPQGLRLRPRVCQHIQWPHKTGLTSLCISIGDLITYTPSRPHPTTPATLPVRFECVVQTCTSHHLWLGQRADIPHIPLPTLSPLHRLQPTTTGCSHLEL